MTNERILLARKLRQVLIDFSPVIETYTDAVCPACADICCKQRFTVRNETDLQYLSALNAPVPSIDPARPPDALCQFLGPTGCIQPRWMRPWRCTWYFCEPLLTVILAEPRKKTIELEAFTGEILRLRNELLTRR